VLRAISEASTLQTFKAGEKLFEEGDQATSLMIVKSGEVEISYRLRDFRKAVAEFAVKGDVVCWSAILAPYRLTATAVGSKDGELLVIDGTTLIGLCEQDAVLGYHLMTAIAKGLRERLTGLRMDMAEKI
jgi:CRP/FNR family cyclic AMP-dependent transcriptional regulator